MELKKSALIVLGSGGHTAEMLQIVEKLVQRLTYSPLYFIYASNDEVTKEKLNNIINTKSNTTAFVPLEIKRSRNVKQSYLTSIFTTLLAFLSVIPLIWRLRPDLILCNGPGTCVPVVVTAWIFKKIYLIPNTKIVYVESFCRVKKLSLSGKIVKRLVDLFVVQWPDLLEQRKNLRYFGRFF